MSNVGAQAPDQVLAMPELIVNGHECRAERTPGGEAWRVYAGKTFLGVIERQGDIDWRILAAFAPDDQLGSRLVDARNVFGGGFELASDAAAVLATAYGYDPEFRQITFRQAIEKDLDMTPEHKAYWLSVCNEEGL